MSEILLFSIGLLLVLCSLAFIINERRKQKQKELTQKYASKSLNTFYEEKNTFSIPYIVFLEFLIGEKDETDLLEKSTPPTESTHPPVRTEKETIEKHTETHETNQVEQTTNEEEKEDDEETEKEAASQTTNNDSTDRNSTDEVYESEDRPRTTDDFDELL